MENNIQIDLLKSSRTLLLKAIEIGEQKIKECENSIYDAKCKLEDVDDLILKLADK